MTVSNRLLPISRPLLRAFVGLALVFGPLLGPAPAAVAAVPFGGPAEEHEEKTGEAKTAIVWAAPAKGGRRPAAPTGTARAADRALADPAPSGPVLLRAAFDDPFRNGLGSPFRC